MPEISIVPANPRDATFIAANMRRQDREEIAAVYPAGPTEIALALLAASEFAFVARLGSEPVAVFGIAYGLPGLGSGWAYGTKRMNRAVPALTRFARRFLAPALIEAGFRRIEVRSAVGHDLSHRWLEALGFRREGIARSFGAPDIDFVTYSAIAGDFPHVLLEQHPAAAGIGADPEPGAGRQPGVGAAGDQAGQGTGPVAVDDPDRRPR